ncbi:MAG: hypothetical protein KJ061_14270 [Vicinamibacteraceae bacterium]|nr:hypothetical protein [Vicinamibacteraceae bacterium]
MRRDGFTFVELLVGLSLSLVVAALCYTALDAAHGRARVAAASADLRQRLQAGEGFVRNRVARAGAGQVRSLAWPGSALPIPPVFPRLRVSTTGDAELDAHADRLTLVRMGATAAWARLASPMASPADALVIDAVAPCGGPVPAPCGLRPGLDVLVVDRTGAFDPAVVTSVTGSTVSAVPGTLSRAYGVAAEAAIVGASLEAILFDAASRTLRLRTAAGANQPILDHVAGFTVRYFGDPVPPDRPRPPPGIASCVVDAAGTPVLAPLGGASSLVELPLAAFTDGPVCGSAPWRYDADLFRVRLVRLSLRLEAGPDEVRGTGPSFARPGTAWHPSRFVPDQEVHIDVRIGVPPG